MPSVARMKNVRETLLEGLFGRPSPHSKAQFKASRQTLFPGESEFIRFLRTDNQQEMFEIAKNILLRIVHHRKLSAPSRSLFNLIHFESDSRNSSTAGNSYIPQDHFVHLVHLYLLGVYLFAQHRGIHQRCCEQLQKVKRSAQGRESARKNIYANLTSYDLFAITWSQFVLCHDLGYPLEAVKPSEREEERNWVWLKPFTNTRKTLAKDLGLKALSRMIAIHSMAKRLSESIDSLGDRFLGNTQTIFLHANGRTKRFTVGDYFSVAEAANADVTSDKSQDASKKENAEESIETEAELLSKRLKRWQHARRFPFIEGEQSLHVFLTVVPESHLGAVLENSITGQPLLLITKEEIPGESGRFIVTEHWFEPPSSAPRRLSSDRKLRLETLAFQHCRSPYKNFVWRYFIEEPQEYVNNLFQELLGDAFEPFSNLARKIESSESFRLAVAVEPDSAEYLSALAYRETLRVLGYLEDEERARSAREVFQAVNRGFSSVSQRFPSLMASCVQDVLIDLVREGSLRPLELLKSSKQQEVAQNSVTALVKARKRLEAKIRGELGPAIKEEVGLEDDARKCLYSVRKGLGMPGETTESSVTPSELLFYKSLEQLTRASTSAVELIDNAAAAEALRSVDALGLGTASDIVRDYQPEHLRQLPKDGGADPLWSFDHGVASALHLADILEVYRDCEKTLRSQTLPEAPKDVRLLRLGFGTISRAEEELLHLERTLAFSISLPAIFVHNLYPSKFRTKEHRQFRTDLVHQPFAFLALFADGLQRWDRKRFIRHEEGDLPNGAIVPGSRYNIEVEGNNLRITLLARGIRLADEEYRLKESLSSYLKDADAMIKLSLAHS